MKRAILVLGLDLSACEQSGNVVAGKPVGTAGSWFVVAVKPGPYGFSSAFAVFAPPDKNQLSYRDILAWLGPGECGRLEPTDIVIPSRSISDPVTFRDPNGELWPASPQPYNDFGVVYMTEPTDAQVGTWTVNVGDWQRSLPLPTPATVLPAELIADGTLSASTGGIDISISPAPAAAYFDIGRWDASGTSVWWDVCRLQEDGTFHLEGSLLSGLPPQGAGLELFVLDTATGEFEGRP